LNPNPANQSTAEPALSQTARNARLALLVGALGVVYGDIGTSPLYALRECFAPHTAGKLMGSGLETTPGNILGVVSLIIWSLIMVVCVKYLTVVMRASNRGEGGTMALLALVQGARPANKPLRSKILLTLGVFGAALLYGDGMITPSVTVLSAVEGLEVATPMFAPYVPFIAVVILVVLFRVQRFGSGKVGGVFGPIMFVWFITLGILGIHGISKAPEILYGLSPHYALLFLVDHGRIAFVVLGAVFLAVTGAEALYADMGHFGAPAIRRAWFSVVFPGLILTYLGEGALLLVNPEAVRNPFFLLAPSWALLPLVGLATISAIIASQAVITGAFSLTMQAIQMGFLPRLVIQHTSEEERGQIYMPQVSNFLMVMCAGLVLGFGSSSRLAGAYGIAVALAMSIDTVLLYSAARRIWKWNIWPATLVCGLFLGVELVFLSANCLKIPQGGWFPLVMGSLLFTVMLTWKKGREMLRSKLSETYLPLDEFIQGISHNKIQRVPGTAIFLAGNSNGTPLALLHNLKHNKVLHERVIILTVITEEVPFTHKSERLEVTTLRDDIFRIIGHYGFMEQPNIPALLNACASHGLQFNQMQTTYFLSRETIIPGKGRGMAIWRRRLFGTLSRNAQSAMQFFQIPPNRVVELGMQVEI
jgi:KUP system potassium uptake protein